MAINNQKIPEVANNHPQRVYVERTQIVEMPPLPQEVKMEEQLEKLEINKSFLKPDSG